MREKLFHLRQSILSDYRSFIILALFALLASGITYALYSYTEQLLTERLRERLIAIASTGAEMFDPNDIENVKNSEEYSPESLEKLVLQLNKVKNANKNIRYAYIMRRTVDPFVLEFVADAESLLTIEELDVNGNGMVEDDEAAPFPGDPFEIHDYPVLAHEAFYQPSADRELAQDQWSVQLSAYAPIYNEKNEAIAIFGIDVVVDDFLRITRATFLPFLLFIGFLILLLTLLTVLLVRFWRQKVEIVREIDRQKDELLGIVSHQLATPVSSISWYLEMLADGDLGKLNNEQSKHIKSMQDITVNLSDLVSMILDVSRIQLGRIKVDKQELDLKSFFEQIISVIEPKAQEKKVEFIVNLPKEYPKAFLDRRYTRMTIENLLSNAVKYTPEGGKVKLSVSINGKVMNCAVTDSGIGIPKSEQEKIFGRMFRASNARNKMDGNGFGLYVAKGAVEAQNGKIWFKSQENKGTEFHVTLPLQ